MTPAPVRVHAAHADYDLVGNRTPMNSDLAAMYAFFEKSPGDTTSYGAVADLLDAEGWAKLAHAFRWMAKRGVWPHRRESYTVGNYGAIGRVVPKNYRWAWYIMQPWQPSAQCPGVVPKSPIGQHWLPRLLLRQDKKAFPTHQDAVVFLATRLAELGETYAVDPPKPKGLPLVEVLSEGYDGKTLREPPTILDEGMSDG